MTQQTHDTSQPAETPAPDTTRKSGPPSPTADGWETAVTVFERWIGPVANGPLQTAKQRYCSFCRSIAHTPGFAKDAPLIAFGFLTRIAFDDAFRKSRIYR